MEQRTYLCIDLKSFYASAECVSRGLDPLTTNLVVADAERTEKTICLAVTPSLKAHGIPGRARLFEVVQRVSEVNALRLGKAPGRRFRGSSSQAPELEADPTLELSYIVAPPRMAYYVECSTKIYSIYLRYIAPEDMHVYSIDEVFMDITAYLRTYKTTAQELAMRIIREVLAETGITATAGIGTNLYLCKIAMDIVAKKMPPDENGVRIAQLDEQSYRQLLWNHRPLTDFWRIGHGYAGKLEAHGLYTMGDVARCSLGGANDFHNEALLYKLFGINAELLIDHAWGWEPCTLADIHRYRPVTNSISSGQVLHCPYTFQKARLIVREMTDLLVLDLVDKGLVTDQLTLTIGYDTTSLLGKTYQGVIKVDHYGRKIPKHAHGTCNLERYCSSTRQITDGIMALYDQIVDPSLLVRRVTITACRVLPEAAQPTQEPFTQLDLFSDAQALLLRRKEEEAALERERRRQKAILHIQKKFGKNAILKAMNLEDGATTIARNSQIGGHRA